MIINGETHKSRHRSCLYCTITMNNNKKYENETDDAELLCRMYKTYYRIGEVGNYRRFISFFEKFIIDNCHIR